VGVLVGIAIVAGMVTAISPCVLPVLPIVFAGSAAGGRGRPYAVVAGLVASFTTFTLAAAALLNALRLPGDLLRNVAIGLVMAMGVGLLVPRIGGLLERPFRALGRRRPGDAGGGFLLGVSLGLLFTPCAGPIIAAVATVAATRHFTVESVLVTLAYALGAGAVLLVLAVAARRGLNVRPLRAHAPQVRQALGALIMAVAVVMAVGLDLRLQTEVPGYTRALQGLEESAAVATRIPALVGAKPRSVGGAASRSADAANLDDFGVAPDFAGIRGWINSAPLDLQRLRGKVVLIDFWTYSCVNCLRTLPYLERWWSAYRDRGLVIVGVHTPEFAFERVRSNVERAVKELGVHYPVALDPDYGTWNAWGNQYWPAEYFIDRKGHVRYVHFGEGEYEHTESVLRSLLAEPGLPPPVAGTILDQTPTEPQTAETYLGYRRLRFYAGTSLHPDRAARYTLPASLPQDAFAYGGTWTVGGERAVAGPGARLRLHYRAGKVFLVLGAPNSGAGRVAVSVDGISLPPVNVTEHKLYELVGAPPDGTSSHELELSFSPGVEAYAFTFGT
jgi:cytochrome c biogenesis protein CcdA/thiol-disulfide isomerase/thioredoxin